MLKNDSLFTAKPNKWIGERMKQLVHMDKFHQFLELMDIFQFLAKSNEYLELNARPISNKGILQQQERMFMIYRHVEEHFRSRIDTALIAEQVNLSVPAFCRYFKKTTRLTYTDFVNQYRVTHARKLLLQHHNVTEACFSSGFESLSYFNRVFKKITGVSPSQFRKRKGVD